MENDSQQYQNFPNQKDTGAVKRKLEDKFEHLFTEEGLIDDSILFNYLDSTFSVNYDHFLQYLQYARVI